MQIDWFNVIIDIERAGMTQQQIAQTVHVSKSALYGWKAGAVPRYDDGEALIRLWELVTNRAPQEIPYTRFFQSRYRKR
ncbi:helix-turn-helix transcriptional regulator [Candidatus Symbiopectobacterium sp.]|uniref:helix-turn-helix domain-containing protein n=1 Tax=Candidatus Symbiopectobacterium sp. TaxID=2816440 RepID=UPI0025C1B146|nr:helix-turn-helix transcriptional regulator [Candidatus Symbiopectobacterium sp.]